MSCARTRPGCGAEAWPCRSRRWSARWFADRFGAPTPAQEAGWPAIAAGADTLIAAPTGSGKTLAAFLWALDRLLGVAAAGALEDRTHVVYVSPLKALGNDIAEEPRSSRSPSIRALRGVATAATLPEIRVAVRTGDTPARERAGDDRAGRRTS